MTEKIIEFRFSDIYSLVDIPSVNLGDNLGYLLFFTALQYCVGIIVIFSGRDV